MQNIPRSKKYACVAWVCTFTSLDSSNAHEAQTLGILFFTIEEFHVGGAFEKKNSMILSYVILHEYNKFMRKWRLFYVN